jgi:hypothetical protein
MIVLAAWYAICYSRLPPGWDGSTTRGRAAPSTLASNMPFDLARLLNLTVYQAPTSNHCV